LYSRFVCQRKSTPLNNPVVLSDKDSPNSVHDVRRQCGEC
jgi:hypothetical protein